jgi:4'-phosphopantetheinyl transferase
MGTNKLPRTIVFSLSIHRGEARFAAVLVMAFEDGLDSLNELAAEFLGPIETEYLSTLRSERRRNSYLLGRYAAKLALREPLSEPDPKGIEIVKGVFEQPIVRSGRKGGWGVTISHAGSLAVCLAFPSEHPLGVDVERIDEARQETILSQLSPREIGWVESSATDRQRVTTALWAAKEALSKVLTTGLMTPIHIYNLSEFSRIDSGIWEGWFQNFGQYKVRVWTGLTYVLAITMPKRSAFKPTADFCALL